MKRLAFWQNDLNIVEVFGRGAEFGLTGGVAVEVEDERGEVGGLLATESAGLLDRHAGANAVEETADGNCFPFVEKTPTGKARRFAFAQQRAAMAEIAFIRVDFFAAIGLFGSINAFQNGTRGSGQQHEGGAEKQKGELHLSNNNADGRSNGYT